MRVVCYCRLSKDDNKSRYSSINAQMELAKEYGGENGAAFVNGILGKIVNENIQILYR